MDEHEFSPRQPAWRRYLRMIRPNPAADFDDELRDHIESTVEALVARGLSLDDARAEAMRRFGDASRVRSEVRRVDARHLARRSRLATLEMLAYDLRHALRALRRSPAFALVATISIALGVAANATVFSAVNAVLFRPIPGTHASGLVRVYVNHHSPFDWRDLAWFRERASSFDHVVGERSTAMSFRASGRDEPERVRASYVTQGFFPGLGARMALGRAFDVADREAVNAPVAVLSWAFWQRRFAGDSSIIGRSILIGDHPLTVVGVMAPEFRGSVIMWAPDVVVPFAIAPVLTGRRLEEFGGSFYTTARLRSEVSMRQASGELGALMGRLALTDRERYEGMTVRLDHTRGVNAELRAGVAAGSAFLMMMVGMVLLVACANVANLLLGRAAARRAEIGVRLAIGASRGRLVRQLLTESFLLAGLGTVAGFAIAVLLTRLIGAAIPPEAGMDAHFLAPDGRVLLFTGVLCVATALLFGTVPALRSSSADLVTLLKGSDSARRRRRGLLVSAQCAMCVLLLAVASLFVRSLTSMRSLDPGFRADGIVDVALDLGLAGDTRDAHRTFATILQDAASLPGVESATLAAVVPLSGNNMETVVLPEGNIVANRRDAPGVYFNIVGPRYFETLRIPLARGREFTDRDDAGAPRVAVLNETAARRLWPDESALGKRLHFGAADGPLVEIVGVAGDADYVMPGEEAKPTVYVPVAQERRAEMTLQLRTTADLATVRRAAWDLLDRVVPGLPPAPVSRMTDDMAITLIPVRVGAGLLGAFGALALVLAAAGIYGVAAYSVARRTREIGIRAALGATKRRLVGMVLVESARRVGAGAAVGVLLTIGVAAALSRVMYGVHALDVVVLVGVVLAIGVVALVATLAPARSAARADPARAMRTE